MMLLAIFRGFKELVNGAGIKTAQFVPQSPKYAVFKSDAPTVLKYPKLDFPVDDVVRNVRAFVGSVKRATGNTREQGQEKQSSNNKKDTKPSTCSLEQGRSVFIDSLQSYPSRRCSSAHLTAPE
jgi:hypothetical protein